MTTDAAIDRGKPWASRRRFQRTSTNMVSQIAADLLGAASITLQSDGMSGSFLHLPIRTATDAEGNYCANEDTKVVSGQVFPASLGPEGQPVYAVRQYRDIGGTVDHDGTEGLKVYDASVGGDGTLIVPGIPVRSIVQRESTRPDGIYVPIPDPQQSGTKQPTTFHKASCSNAALARLASSNGLSGAKLKGIVIGRMNRLEQNKPPSLSFAAESIFPTDTALCFARPEGTAPQLTDPDIFETMFGNRPKVFTARKATTLSGPIGSGERKGNTEPGTSDVEGQVDFPDGSSVASDSLSTAETLLGEDNASQAGPLCAGCSASSFRPRTVEPSVTISCPDYSTIHID
ncbi:hypothetical protein IAT40_004511 [Kwoniella sp. CBS 6097]